MIITGTSTSTIADHTSPTPYDQACGYQISGTGISGTGTTRPYELLIDPSALQLLSSTSTGTSTS